MHWKQFTHSAFAVEFRYPDPTPEGHRVERADEDRADMQRVHLSSPESGELYFETTRFAGLAPQDEYARHCPYLAQRFGEGAVTELSEAIFGDRPAWRYSFSWNGGTRAVLLVDLGGDTYRFIYDPRSPLNDAILATVTILE